MSCHVARLESSLASALKNKVFAVAFYVVSEVVEYLKISDKHLFPVCCIGVLIFFSVKTIALVFRGFKKLVIIALLSEILNVVSICKNEYSVRKMIKPHRCYCIPDVLEMNRKTLVLCIFGVNNNAGGIVACS